MFLNQIHVKKKKPIVCGGLVHLNLPPNDFNHDLDTLKGGLWKERSFGSLSLSLEMEDDSHKKKEFLEIQTPKGYL